MKLSGESKSPARLTRSAPSKRSSRTRLIASSAASIHWPSPKHNLDEEDVIAAFLHGSHLGVFELSWSILCPGCGGMLDTGITLKTVKQTEYNCALCAAGYEPTLDEIVEVTFTVSSRIRSIAAHHPETLPWIEEVFVTTIARARASRDGQVLTFVDK